MNELEEYSEAAGGCSTLNFKRTDSIAAVNKIFGSLALQGVSQAPMVQWALLSIHRSVALAKDNRMVEGRTYLEMSQRALGFSMHLLQQESDEDCSCERKQFKNSCRKTLASAIEFLQLAHTHSVRIFSGRAEESIVMAERYLASAVARLDRLEIELRDFDELSEILEAV